MALRALQGPVGGGAPVGGTGTTNYIPRWNPGPSTLGDSVLVQVGTGIGLGTSTLYTGTKLQVSGSGGVAAITSEDTNGGGNFLRWLADTTNQPLINWTTGSALRFATSTSAFGTFAEWMRITSTGNVGIGTASPQEKTQIYGDLKVGVLASGAYISLGDEATTQKNVGVARFPGDTALSIGGYGGIRFYSSATQITGQTERMRISNAGTAAQSQVAIGTTSFTTGRALTTVADLDVFGVRVGRGNNGVASNTAVGSGALGAVTSAPNATAVGVNALAALTTGTNNTAVGLGAASATTTSYNNTAVGVSALGAMTTNAGFQNVALGVSALGAATSAKNNVALGMSAGAALTTGSSNIIIGSGADVAAVGDSNQLVLGDATNYVATNGGATTYYATAGASLGYMRVRLNGTYVKIEVFADV